MKHYLKFNLQLLALSMVFIVACNTNKSKTTGNELDKLPIDSVKAIAKEAYIYAYPVVDAYRI